MKFFVWDDWYRLFPFKKNDCAAEDDSFSGEEGDVVEGPAVDASQVGRTFNTSDGEEDEAGVADGDILRDGDKEADIAAVDIWNLTRYIIGIYQVYTMYIPRGGIYLVYTRCIQLILKFCFHAFMCNSML